MAARQHLKGTGLGVQYEDLVPKSEWKDQPEATILTIDLPGFAKEQIKVTYVHTSRVIRVTGERPLADRRWSRFNEVFTVPQNCLVDKIHGSFKNNSLTITLPKETITKTSNLPESSKTVAEKVEKIEEKRLLEESKRKEREEEAEKKKKLLEEKEGILRKLQEEAKAKEMAEARKLQEEAKAKEIDEKVEKLWEKRLLEESRRKEREEEAEKKKKKKLLDEKEGILRNLQVEAKAKEMAEASKLQEEAKAKEMAEARKLQEEAKAKEMAEARKLQEEAKAKEMAEARKLQEEAKATEKLVEEAKFQEKKTVEKILKPEERKLPEVDYTKLSPGSVTKSVSEGASKVVKSAEEKLGYLMEKEKKIEKGIMEKIRGRDITSEEKKLMVNVGVAALVIFALGAYVSYTFCSSSSSSSSSPSSSAPSTKPE